MTTASSTSASATYPSAEGVPSGDVLVARGLRKAFRGRLVVDDVSFEVRPGEVVGLLGPNGAGKTTSFRMVAGLVDPDGGSVALGGNDLTGLPLYRRARLGLGYLPQEPSVFRRLTVRQNFAVAFESVPRLSAAEKDDRIDALLREFRIEAIADSRGESLSGGERRRVEIARLLIPGPRCILFDEPFAGVDPIAVKDLQGQIASLRDRGLGVLITDHAVRETLGICDRAYILVGGRVLEEGTPASLASSERARRVYLGTDFHL